LVQKGGRCAILDRRPTENDFAKLTPFFLRFRWYLSDGDARLIASRILKRNVKVAVLFRSYLDHAPC